MNDSGVESQREAAGQVYLSESELGLENWQIKELLGVEQLARSKAGG